MVDVIDGAVAAGTRSVLEVAGDAVADAGTKVVGITVLAGVFVCIGESIDFSPFLSQKEPFPPLVPGGKVASWCWFLDLDSVL